MRGAIQYEELMWMSHVERKVVEKFLEKRMDVEGKKRMRDAVY